MAIPKYVLPVPISNTVVKVLGADDTIFFGGWESRYCGLLLFAARFLYLPLSADMIKRNDAPRVKTNSLWSVLSCDFRRNLLLYFFPSAASLTP